MSLEKGYDGSLESRPKVEFAHEKILHDALHLTKTIGECLRTVWEGFNKPSLQQISNSEQDEDSDFDHNSTRYEQLENT